MELDEIMRKMEELDELTLEYSVILHRDDEVILSEETKKRLEYIRNRLPKLWKEVLGK